MGILYLLILLSSVIISEVALQGAVVESNLISSTPVIERQDNLIAYHRDYYHNRNPTPTPTAFPRPTPRVTATPIPTPVPTATPKPTPTTQSTPTPTATLKPTANPLWSTNAEISSLNQLGIDYYIEKDVSTDSVTISTNQAHTASHSFKLTTSGKRIELDVFPTNQITTDFYYTAWYYIPSSFNVGSYFTIFQLEGLLASGYYPIWAFMFSSGDEHALLYGRGNRGTQLGNGGDQADSKFILPRDTWWLYSFYLAGRTCKKKNDLLTGIPL